MPPLASLAFLLIPRCPGQSQSQSCRCKVQVHAVDVSLLARACHQSALFSPVTSTPTDRWVESEREVHP